MATDKALGGLHQVPAGQVVQSHGSHIGVSSPYAISSRKFGMWLFIISDAITFAVFLVAYGYLRLASENWPRPFEFRSSILNATVMTVVLLTSSLTMVFAVRAAKLANWRGASTWIFATMTGGIIFAVLHIREWIGLIHEGVRLYANPWGAPDFGAAFFSLTGLHILHVTAGVIYLLVVGIMARRRKITADGVEISALYWSFVDLVWLFIFPLVYLTSAK